MTTIPDEFWVTLGAAGLKAPEIRGMMSKASLAAGQQHQMGAEGRVSVPNTSLTIVYNGGIDGWDDRYYLEDSKKRRSMSPFEEAFFESINEQIDALGESNPEETGMLYEVLRNLRDTMLRKLGLKELSMVLAYPTMSDKDDRPEINYLILFHGPQCDYEFCGRKPGDRMFKASQVTSLQSEYEWDIAKSRIDDMIDHVGSAIRYGPHVGKIEYYPKRK